MKLLHFHDLCVLATQKPLNSKNHKVAAGIVADAHGELLYFFNAYYVFRVCCFE